MLPSGWALIILKPEPCNQGLDNALQCCTHSTNDGLHKLGLWQIGVCGGRESVTVCESNGIPKDNAISLWRMHGHSGIDGRSRGGLAVALVCP